MGSELERRVVELVTAKQKESPVVWAMEVGNFVEAVPSIELGEVLVSQLCFQHNRPSLWKFIDHALSSGILCPLHVLSILSSRYPSFPFNSQLSHWPCHGFVDWRLLCRVVPHRRAQPEAYRLYLELLRRYAFSFGPLAGDASKEK